LIPVSNFLIGTAGVGAVDESGAASGMSRPAFPFNYLIDKRCDFNKLDV
jgi:hypothetical protein